MDSRQNNARSQYNVGVLYFGALRIDAASLAQSHERDPLLEQLYSAGVPATAGRRNCGHGTFDKRAQETHDAVMEELQGLRRLYQSQSEEMAEIKEMHQESRQLLRMWEDDRR